MSGPSTVIWSLDEHTRAKHEILRRYLQGWLPIMTRYNGKIIFIDGFAGPGEYIGGEVGSPIIAIDTFLNHSYQPIHNNEVIFLFIEQDKARFEHLEQLLSNRLQKHLFPPKSTYQVLQGNFNITMDDLLNQQGRLAPTFAFIDPFGFSHTPMYTIKRLMEHPKCEVLITFMYEEINRFLTADYPTKEVHYNELFGTSEWKDIVQADSNDKSSNTRLSAKEREAKIHDLYQKQLKTVASYVRSFRMRNKHNSTDYFLFFATNSLVGMDKMKCSMCQVDQSGSYEFSDFTNPNQLVLFQPQPDYNLLQQMLRQHFQGTIASIKEIEDYVIADTPFCSAGCKTKALKPMEKATPPQIEVVNCPPKRRSGTYATPDIRIRFL